MSCSECSNFCYWTVHNGRYCFKSSYVFELTNVYAHCQTDRLWVRQVRRWIDADATVTTIMASGTAASTEYRRNCFSAQHGENTIQRGGRNCTNTHTDGSDFTRAPSLKQSFLLFHLGKILLPTRISLVFPSSIIIFPSFFI